MSRTCKWGVLTVVGGEYGIIQGDALITPANNRLSGREGLDSMVRCQSRTRTDSGNSKYLFGEAENQRPSVCSNP